MYLNFEKTVTKLGFEGQIGTWFQKSITEDLSKRLITVSFLRRLKKAKSEKDLVNVIKLFKQRYNHKGHDISITLRRRSRKLKSVHFSFFKEEVFIKTDYRYRKK